MVSFLVQRVETQDAKYNLIFKLLVWPHEVEPWFHSWYRGRVETLEAKMICYANSSKRDTSPPPLPLPLVRETYPIDILKSHSPSQEVAWIIITVH